MILNEATFYKEIDLIVADIWDRYKYLSSYKQKNIDITHFFIKHLPDEISNIIKRKSIKIYLAYKNVDDPYEERIETIRHFENKNASTVIIKYFSNRELKRIYLRHEITHAIDMIRAYPNETLSNKFTNVINHEFYSKTKNFIDNKKKYKDARAEKIGWERTFGDMYTIYNKENIELNQRVTEFVHNIKTLSSFRTKVMNNNFYDKTGYVSNYEDLIRIIFKRIYSSKMLKDDELKSYLIKRFNREGVLKYINPEVFNRKIISQNTKNLNAEKTDKLINAKNLIKKEKNVSKEFDSHEELRKKLEAYKKERNLKKRRIQEEVQEETLEEGIKYSKTSHKLFRLLEVLVPKLERIEGQEERRSMITLINKIDRLAKKFEKVEIDYKVEKILKNKNPEAKKKYAELTMEFADLIKMAKKEDIKKILKTTGSLSLLFAAMVIPYEVLSKVNPIINPENSNVKRALSIIGMSMPFRLINTNKIFDKVIKNDVVSIAHSELDDKDI